MTVIALLLAWTRTADGQAPTEAEAESPAQAALVLDIEGPIGPATRDFITRTIEQSNPEQVALLILRLDTPGGLDASTRDIVKAILASPIPVATFVAPEGARAASAGTYILYASHLAVMSPATNLGAATPVAMGAPQGAAPGTGRPGKGSKAAEPEAAGAGGDAEAPVPDDSSDAMSRKAVNDSAAWIRGLARLRGRNADWAEEAVRAAESITSEQALELGVIDFIAVDLGDLLEQAHGRQVEVGHRIITLNTRGLTTEAVKPDWRNTFLAAITSPTIAYLLLLIGIYGLILEGYHPGAILPGVTGAICLLLALYALQMLPVNYAGLGLILLGVILMIAEVMAPSFGALGIGGIIAMVIGSIILIDTDVPGFQVSMPLIGALAVTGALGLMAIIGFAVKARQRPVVSGREQLIGAQGVALAGFDETGEVFVHSERWTAISDRPVFEGQRVEVTGLEDLTLRVRPLDD
jgi:membrane-bound serine protease (ClpP class)